MERRQQILVGFFATVLGLVGVYLARGNFANQQANLSDAGITGPSHVAKCRARLSDECFADILAAGGYDVDAGDRPSKYTRVRFPVFLATLADGGKEVQMPPMRKSDRDCVEVMRWEKCSFVDAGDAPVVANLWGDSVPFKIAGGNPGCVRPNFDAGLLCKRLYPDGGRYNFGDRNVYPAAEADRPNNDCERVECEVLAGDNPEEAL